MHPPLGDGHTQSAAPSSPNDKSQPASALQVGQVFIPRRVLNSGVFVPDGLLPCRLISNRAKLLWARLAHYAGSGVECFPLLSTSARDMGVCPRQVQRYLSELVTQGFLRVCWRGLNQSNPYEFLWHPALEEPSRPGASEPEGDTTTVVAWRYRDNLCRQVTAIRKTEM